MSVSTREVIDTDIIRNREQLRLASARRGWDEAKEQLAAALALVETRANQYRAIQEEVEKNLAALELVTSMNSESGCHADQVRPDAPEQAGFRLLSESGGLEVKTAGDVENSDDNRIVNRSWIPTRVIVRWRPVFPRTNWGKRRPSILQLD